MMILKQKKKRRKRAMLQMPDSEIIETDSEIIIH